MPLIPAKVEPKIENKDLEAEPQIENKNPKAEPQIENKDPESEDEDIIEDEENQENENKATITVNTTSIKQNVTSLLMKPKAYKPTVFDTFINSNIPAASSVKPVTSP